MRLPNWQAALDSFLREHERERFRYGSWDCCLFVANAIQVMTGQDFAAEFRGHYASRVDAYRELEKRTGKASVRAVAEQAAERFRLREITAGYAQRGDMVLLRRSHHYSLGLVALNGREVLIARARGLWRISLSNAVKVWSIG